VEPIDTPTLHALSSKRQLYDLMYHVESLKEGKVLEINEFEDDLENVNRAKFEKAYEVVFRRHESLRTVFRLIQEEVKQAIHPYSPERFKILIYDLSSMDAVAQARERNAVKLKVESSFEDLEKGPLAQGVLFRNTNTRYRFIFYCHHILADGYSMKLFYYELLTAYESLLNDAEIELPPIDLTCRQFLERRNELGQGDYEKKRSSYWNNKLQTYLFPIERSVLYKNFGIDDSDVPVGNKIRKKDFNKAEWFGYVTAMKNKQALLELSSEVGITPQIILLSTFFLCVHICFSVDTMIVVNTVPDRNDKTSRHIIGNLFGNVFLKSVSSPEMTLKEMMIKIYMDFLQSCRYPIFDFKRLDSFETRDRCEFLINYLQMYNHKDIETSKTCYTHLPDKEYYSLSFIVNEYKNGFAFRWVYQADLYSPQIMEKMANAHIKVLQEFMQNPTMTIGALTSLIFPD